jgi:hypothetical protein
MTDRRPPIVIALPSEVFTYTFIDGRRMMWNIDRAKAILDSGRGMFQTIALTRDAMQDTLTNNDIDAAKLAAADPAQPGIGAPCCFAGHCFYLLIDGTHRAVKALQTNVGFDVRLLTDEAARECLMMADAGPVPWDQAGR